MSEKLGARAMESPVGELTLVASDGALVAVLWRGEEAGRVQTTAASHDVLDAAARQLSEYFSGTRRVFDLPLDFRGTAFQRDVWAALLAIPYGETCTYGEIARAIGRPSASRAVGAANGRNPMSIVAPCHRVIGASGALTGFGGGIAAKRTLLDLERDRGISSGWLL